MLIKLTPPASAAPTPTILFAIAFPDLPQNLPIPAAWSAQLARLAADDLEAPPALHALDRAAALPSLLGEVLFDLPRQRVACTFLDGAAEEWDMDARCAEMLARVIRDVEESGKAEERSREWQRALEVERARAEEEREQEAEREQEVRERQAEREKEYEREVQKAKGKEQSLNSPPASPKATRSKGRLNRSRSLLMALVASFSAPSPSPPSPTLPPAPASAPATRSSFSSPPRSPSSLRAFARRASFSALSSMARGDPMEASSPTPAIPHNLETPPASAPPSAASSAFSKHQKQASTPFPALSQRREEMSPRALRRRARSTLVDAFRAHVLPELGGRVGLFEASPLRVRVEDASDAKGDASGIGGGYHSWVARSMLRRAEARMRELEGAWPALTSPTRSQHSHSGSADSQSHSVSYPQFSPNSVSFPTSPRHATFEPWSSDESDSDEYYASDSELEDSAGGDTDTDGSSVHTPESGHSIPYGHGHALEVSTSTTSSYFTCSDPAEVDAEEEDQDALPSPTPSHIRRAAQSSPLHSRAASAVHPPRRPSSSHSEARQAKRELRERKRVQRAARAEHTDFARMTARLRLVLSQSASARSMLQGQKDDCDRLRESRGVRRGWLDGGKGAAVFTDSKKLEMGRAFRPSGLGRWVSDATDAIDDAEVSDFEGLGSDSAHSEDKPPSYEDVLSQSKVQGFGAGHPIRRTRTSPPIQRIRTTLEHLDDLDLDVDLEHLELDAVELEGLNIDVDLEHLDLTDSLDVEGMGLDIDVDGDMAFGDVDVFADVSGKGKGKGRRRAPISGKARREAWERRRMVPI
ncbi:hypothetical protein C8R43DRAFT_196752 [Mycena crocata]|nr:hypothetical protein C8R43DRAFT_196752 [Mycena crocata]